MDRHQELHEENERLRAQNAKMRKALKAFVDEHHRCTAEIRETGYSDFAVTAGMMCDAYEALRE